MGSNCKRSWLCCAALMVVACARPCPVARAQQVDEEEMAALQDESREHLKQLCIAMQNHHDVFKSFPAAYRSKKDGKPLLSWRVSILPFIEEQVLYKQFHLDEPWDSKHNLVLAQQMPDAYRSPASKLKDARTVYLTVRGERTAFPGKDAVRIRQVIDGTSKTIGLVEVDDAQAVIWTKPDDWPVDPNFPRVGFRGPYPDAVLVGALDGSVRFVPLDVEEATLKALLTINGRERVAFPDAN